MADAPNSPGPGASPFGRPLSPHLQIYRWTITMAASITHRVTGIALAAGTLFLAWWLIAAASGPDAYGLFMRLATNLLGEVVLFGFLWALAFHLLNGIRHLAWDVGYGFKVPTAKLTAALVYGVSLLLAAGAFVVGIMVRGGLGT
ncbi:MAG TPA: succinate dehydrogenase, cytochrome b556 subunit [Micropepsaceae bacterium]|jgi:succinate dehydrogenase / fumarate reductase cytochrome b subunit